jgi:hypothetical protein
MVVDDNTPLRSCGIGQLTHLPNDDGSKTSSGVRYDAKIVAHGTMQLPLLRRDTILGLVLSVQYLLYDNHLKPHDNLNLNVVHRTEERKQGAHRSVVWAHNSYVGDALAKRHTRRERWSTGDSCMQTEI